MERQQLSQREKKTIYMMKYNPKYRESHQESIQETRNAYMQKKTVCSCGMEVIRNNLTQHLKTKKHSNALDEKRLLEAHQSEEA